MLVLFVSVFRIALEFIELVHADRVGMGFVAVVVVDQDYPCRKWAQYERGNRDKCSAYPDRPRCADPIAWHRGA